MNVNKGYMRYIWLSNLAGAQPSMEHQQYIYSLFGVAKSAAKSDFAGKEARVLSGMWMLPYIYVRISIASNAALLTPVKCYT